MILPKLVIYLDMDGTMIGDVEELIKEEELESYMSDNDVVGDKRTNMGTYFKSGLVRPYLKFFLQNIKYHYGNQIEFFIYTAAEDNWAHKIIPKIEKQLEFAVTRPLFTRKDCNNYQKSLEHIRPRTITALVAKYMKIYSRKSMTKDKREALKTQLTNHFTVLLKKDKRSLLIDNTPGVLKESERMVLCPTYDFLYPIDYVQKYVTPQNVKDKNKMSVVKVLQSILFPRTPFDNPMFFYKRYHKDLRKTFKKALKINTTSIEDRYWEKMCYKILYNDKLIRDDKMSSIKDIIQIMRQV
jgi:hypothetical protein